MQPGASHELPLLQNWHPKSALAQTALDKPRPLIGLFLALLGAFITAVGIDMVRDGSEASKWPKVTGEITATEVVHKTLQGASPGARKQQYRAELSYHYDFDGRRHAGSRFHIGGSPAFHSAKRAEQFLTEYPVGTKVVVFVNPKLPDWAVLSTGVPAAAKSITAMGALFLLVGGGLIVQWLRARASRRRLANPPPSPQPAGS